MRRPVATSALTEPAPEPRSLSRLFLRAFVVCCVAGLAVADGLGQNKPEGTDTASSVISTPEPGSAAGVIPHPGDTVWVRGPDGKPVPLVVGLTPEKIRELLRQGQTPGAAKPPYYIANLAATGVVEKDLNRANLSLVIDVSVDGDRAVRVPLRLNEGTLLNQKHAGTGTVAFEPPARTEELVCWFSGAGIHELTLDLSVPVRKTSAGYRILLSLPDSTVNSLDLTIPQGKIQVKPASARTQHDTTTISDAESRLRAHQLGTAIDLTWQEVLGQNMAKAELQAQTLIEAHVEADDVRLEVTQTVISPGSFQEIFVQIPSTFFVAEVVDRNFPQLNWEMAGNSRLRIDPGTVTSRLDLQLILTTKATDSGTGSPPDEQQISVSGLTVEGATRQDGLLGLTVAEGFGVEVSQVRSVRRIGISSFRRLAGARLREASQSFRYAWQFDDTAFQISLNREKIDSSFVVRPRYTLTVGQGEKPEAVLHAVLDLQVFRGKLDLIQLSWPNFRSEGWSEPVITEPKSGADVTLPGTGQAQDILTLALHESISRSEARSIELQCTRPISLDDFPVNGKATFGLTLPVPIAQRRTGFQLTVKNGGSIRSTLVPEEGTRVTLLPVRSNNSFSPRNTHDISWQVNSEQLQFAAKAQSFEQQISCETKVTATINDEACLVEQVFDYDVLFRRLNEVRLMVPAGRAPQFWLLNPQSNERKPLAPQLTGVEDDDRVQFRLNLTPDMWGRFQIVAQFELPLGAEDARPEHIAVPVLASSDAPSRRTHLEIRSPDNLRVVPEDSTNWEPELTLSRLPGWVTNDERKSVPLSLNFSQERARQNFTIRRAAIETRFLPTPRSQAAYVIDGDVSFLTIRFPASIDLSRKVIAWWDGEKLTPGQIRPVSENSREFAVDTGDLPPGEQHVLAVEYDSTVETVFGSLNELRLASPQFAPDVWLAETQWNIVLPVGQHLSIYPDDYSPRFEWQLQNVLWDRQPVPGQSPPGRWLFEDSVAGTQSDSEYDPRRLVPFDWFGGTAFGNSYRFSNFGGQHEIQFQTMSQPAIVLCGAGFALTIGFILLRIPATRHVLTFLTLGFVTAAIALWKPEPIQLLLQPAVFGLLLAIVAAVLENRTRRTQQASLVTLSSPDDFLAESEDEVALHVEPPVRVEEAEEDGSAA